MGAFAYCIVFVYIIAMPTTVLDGQDDAAELYPIRTVAALTGVNPITLRAWERRYGLARPQRTAGGHRLYSRTQVDQIHRILGLLSAGVAISQVPRALGLDKEAAPRARALDEWARLRARMLAAIARFDEAALDEAYSEALALHPIARVTRQVLLPLLAELGDRWATAHGSVAEEHFFSAYLRNKLGARFHHRARLESGARLLLACVPGEQHEFGALLFGLAAQDAGYRTLLLGPNMPLEELAPVARLVQLDAIVLSGSVEPAAGVLGKGLHALVQAARLPVCIGGLSSLRHRDAIVAAGAYALGTDIERGLRQLRELVPPAPKARP
jgi:DNA-binding transcriptional MerR regulator